MSAIFGVTNFKQKNINILGKVEETFRDYKIDNFTEMQKENTYMACGIQYITEESVNEVLPYYDETEALMITADAIIDNRKELIYELGVDENEMISDSQFILLAYKKWDEKCVEHLIGDFSFAIYDESKERLFCARDHTGRRTFYYYKTEETFAFSTLTKTLRKYIGDKVELNDRWVVDYLTLIGVLHEDECEETIYKDIYQIPPAHYLIATKDGVKLKEYWKPLEKVKKLEHKTDEEYNEEFKKIFFEAVNCRLRSINGVAVSVSGGLDSTAVAAVAANTLKKQGKKLKCFTTVPMKGYKEYLPKSKIADEREYVEELRDYVGNMELNFCNYEGKDALTDVEKVILALEQPHKIVENMTWINEVMKLTSQNNCKVLLNAQNGNCNISYGDFLTYIKTLVYSGKFGSLAKEMSDFAKLRNLSKKTMFQGLCKALKPKFFCENEKFGNTSFLKDELYKKFNVAERFSKNTFLNRNDYVCNEEEIKYYLINPISFSHLAHIETKLGLYNGIMKRDPTRDVRLIEFCLSLPYDQYVRNGQERYLIRRAMKDMVPDSIRLNYKKRGLQSADWIQRLQLRWTSIKDDIEKTIDSNMNNKYLDMNKLKKSFLEVQEKISEDNQMELREILVAYIFLKYIDIYEKEVI